MSLAAYASKTNKRTKTTKQIYQADFSLNRKQGGLLFYVMCSLHEVLTPFPGKLAKHNAIGRKDDKKGSKTIYRKEMSRKESKKIRLTYIPSKKKNKFLLDHMQQKKMKLINQLTGKEACCCKSHFKHFPSLLVENWLKKKVLLKNVGFSHCWLLLDDIVYQASDS